ncbi:hypothetical protein M5689_014393 [Euphorbia peplus]|nr:hypothetical protein M5689_014393 [Euphorbia peplus]
MRCLGGKWFWGPQCIPRHRFVTWIALQGKLAVQARCHKWQRNIDEKCGLCNQVNVSKPVSDELLSMPLCNGFGWHVTGNNVFIPNYYYNAMQASDHSSSCPSKMIGVLLQEKFFNSASEVDFNAGYMHWTVDSNVALT